MLVEARWCRVCEVQWLMRTPFTSVLGAAPLEYSRKFDNQMARSSSERLTSEPAGHTAHTARARRGLSLSRARARLSERTCARTQRSEISVARRGPCVGAAVSVGAGRQRQCFAGRPQWRPQLWQYLLPAKPLSDACSRQYGGALCVPSHCLEYLQPQGWRGRDHRMATRDDATMPRVAVATLGVGVPRLVATRGK